MIKIHRKYQWKPLWEHRGSGWCDEFLATNAVTRSQSLRPLSDVLIDCNIFYLEVVLSPSFKAHEKQIAIHVATKWDSCCVISHQTTPTKFEYRQCVVWLCTCLFMVSVCVWEKEWSEDVESSLANACELHNNSWVIRLHASLPCYQPHYWHYHFPLVSTVDIFFVYSRQNLLSNDDDCFYYFQQ